MLASVTRSSLPLLVACLVFLGCDVYLVPTWIAFHRGVVHRGSVFVVNLLLGWSVVGWVVALAMAVRSSSVGVSVSVDVDSVPPAVALVKEQSPVLSAPATTLDSLLRLRDQS